MRPEEGSYKAVASLIRGKNSICITSHEHPDGDAIGSGLALLHAMKQLRKDVTFIIPNEYPSFLAWMPGSDDILVYATERDRCREAMQGAEVIFCVDYNAPERLEDARDLLTASTVAKVLIDHHTEPQTNHFDLMLTTTDTSSTAELVYELILSLDPVLMSKEIAECIYAGIMTDTGSFSYSCNHVRTYEIVAELFRQGIDGEKIHRLVYNTFTESRMRLLGYCLSSKLKVLPEYHTAYIALSRDELDSYNYQTGDTEGIVNYALSIKGIKLAVLFTEKDDRIRMSLRSIGEFSVNEFARKHYDGGGHKNAAGCNSFLTLSETLSRFESLLEDYHPELKHA
jgi:phosphoesterase RecJ-like protein